MVLRQLRNLSIIGGGLALFFLYTTTVHAAAPALQVCTHDYDCLVPTPTVIAPAQGTIVEQQKLVITGLSWNETAVEVYIDDAYSGRAVLRTDPSQIGNFFHQPVGQLAPGQHSFFVVAYNLSESEQSRPSPEVTFTIRAAQAPQPAPAPETNVPAEPTPTSSIAPTEPTSTEASANSVLDWFFNKQPASSTAATTTPLLRTVSGRTTLVLLLVVVLAVLIGVRYVQQSRRKKAGNNDANGENDDFNQPHLPPPL